jgi:hypothetical protein
MFLVFILRQSTRLGITDATGDKTHWLSKRQEKPSVYQSMTTLVPTLR